MDVLEFDQSLRDTVAAADESGTLGAARRYRRFLYPERFMISSCSSCMESSSPPAQLSGIWNCSSSGSSSSIHRPDHALGTERPGSASAPVVSRLNENKTVR